MLRVLYELKFTKNYKKGVVPNQSYSQRTLRPVKRLFQVDSKMFWMNLNLRETLRKVEQCLQNQP